MYTESIEQEFEDTKDTKNPSTWLKQCDFLEMFYKVCNIIDTSIKEWHGIKCYEDGDIKNENPTNYYILHVCDVMNIMVHINDTDQPKLVVESSLLKTISATIKISGFDIFYDTNTYHSFFKTHVDIFYLCYAYYGNYSFVPIRTLVSKEDSMFKQSSFFTNDDHFVKHQSGKLQEIKQNEKKYVSRAIYRTG